MLLLFPVSEYADERLQSWLWLWLYMVINSVLWKLFDEISPVTIGSHIAEVVEPFFYITIGANCFILIGFPIFH